MRHRRLGLALVFLIGCMLLVSLSLLVCAWRQERLLVERDAAHADVARLRGILYGPLFSMPAAKIGERR